jgi:hypothetical protein
MVFEDLLNNVANHSTTVRRRQEKLFGRISEKKGSVLLQDRGCERWLSSPLSDLGGP